MDKPDNKDEGPDNNNENKNISNLMTSTMQAVAWTEQLSLHSGYNETSLRACAKDMCILLQGIERCSLQAVKKKFSQP